jgi:hypothetical protein
MGEVITEEEQTYNMFVSLLKTETISWPNFSKLSEYPNLFRKAIGKMLELKVLSFEAGCEVVFSPTNYSMNSIYEGRRTYFTTQGRAQGYLDYLVGSALGKRLKALVVGPTKDIPPSPKSLFQIRKK